MDDAETVADLLNTCSVEQIGKPETDAAEIRSDWGQPMFHLETDTLVVFAPDGQLVGHAALWDEEPHVRTFVAADVHSAHRGRGVGAALEAWAETRVRQSLPKTPPEARVVLVQEALSTNELARTFLTGRGYQPVRHSFRMTMDLDTPLPEPMPPDGIPIRPFVAGREMPAIVESIRETFRDHWGFVERPFDEDYQSWIHFMDSDPYCDPSLWFVAVDNGSENGQDEIVGTCFCHPWQAEDPDMGWIYALGVRRSWRRRGLATALLRHSCGELHRNGKRRVGLGVDAQSLTGAIRLYERAGMRVERQYVTYEKELRPGRELSTQFVESDVVT
jgi:mycothiol synthase